MLLVTRSSLWPRSLYRRRWWLAPSPAASAPRDGPPTFLGAAYRSCGHAACDVIRGNADGRPAPYRVCAPFGERPGMLYGRDREVSDLLAIQTPVTLISGDGGVGKTQLLAEIA